MHKINIFYICTYVDPSLRREVRVFLDLFSPVPAVRIRGWIFRTLSRAFVMFSSLQFGLLVKRWNKN